MNFFGGSNCGDVTNGCGIDSCSLVFLLLLLQNCGGLCGGMKGGEITIDCNTILILLLLSGLGIGGCGCK